MVDTARGFTRPHQGTGAYFHRTFRLSVYYCHSGLADVPSGFTDPQAVYSATAYSTSALYCIRPSDCILPSTSPASCSGVTVVSRHASQFVYTRPASLRIMLAAYCPNNPSGAGKTMAPPMPHAASGAYPAQHRPDG